MLFFLLFLEKYKATASEETFIKTEEAEILLEKHLRIQWVWGLFLKYTHLLALELALKSKLDESSDLPTYSKLF